MSSSSMPPLTPSDTPPNPSSTGTFPSDPPVKVPVRRTYGRQKHVSPPPKAQSPPPPSSVDAPQPSPHKRWANANDNLLASMASLDPNAGGDNEEYDEEMVRREYDRMRKSRLQSRFVPAPDPAPADGTPLEGPSHVAPAPAPEAEKFELEPTQGDGRAEDDADKTPKAAPHKASLYVTVNDSTHSSSSLSGLPPSSPPQRKFSSTNSLSNGEEGQSSQSGASVDTFMAQRERHEEDESLSPEKRAGKGLKKRVFVESDESDADVSPESPIYWDKQDGPADESENEKHDIDALMQDVAEEEQVEGAREGEAERARTRNEKKEKEMSKRVDPLKGAGMDGLFDDDDDDEEEQKKVKKKSSKGLNKNDKKQMHKDIEAAKRSQTVHLARPKTQARSSMDSWMSTYAVSNASSSRAHPSSGPAESIEEFYTPVAERTATATTRAESKMPSSQIRLADSIVTSSPSTANRLGQMGASSKPLLKSTPAMAEDAINDGEEKQEFAAMVADLDARKDAAEAANARAAEKAVKQAELQRRKLALVAKAKQAEASRKGAKNIKKEEDDDFEIVEVPGKPARRALTSLPHGATLHYKPRASASEISETYLDHAGKKFNHAQERSYNAGSRPAGQKRGRDKAILQNEWDRKLLQMAAKQSVSVRQSKAKLFGEGKMKIPEKQKVDFNAMTEEIRRKAEEVKDEEEEDEDGDDDEYVDGEEAEGADEEEDAVDEDAEEEEEIEEDEPDVKPVKQEEDEEESVAFPRTKPRPSARRQIVPDSDDEDTAPASTSEHPLPLPASATQRTTQKPSGVTFALNDDDKPMVPADAGSEEGPGEDSVDFGGFDVDLGGFGDDTGGGFSQLFSETQVDNAEDALAKLRKPDASGLAPTLAVLPEVEISETQMARDDALVMGVMEDAAMENRLEAEAPKKMYLNTQGMFTQTRPHDWEDEPELSQRYLDDTQTTPFSYSQRPPYPSSTQQNTNNTSLPPSERDAADVSPTQPKLRRLKRRSSPAPEAEDAEDEDERETTPELEETQVSPAPRDAFSALMDHRNRRGPSEPAKSRNDKGKENQYIQRQAEESDDEEMGGWLKTSDNEDDEASGDEEDGVVEGLVNDAQMSEAERERNQELGRAKQREIEKEDDERRMKAAKDLTEGKYRKHRRGEEFVDDDGEEQKQRYNKLSKKTRKVIDENDREGILEGEETKYFQAAYADEPEPESDDEAKAWNSDFFGFGGERSASPELQREKTPTEQLDYRERRQRLREVAEKNKSQNMDAMDDEMDKEIGLDDETFTAARHPLGDTSDSAIDLDAPVVAEPEFSVSRGNSKRRSTAHEAPVDEYTFKRPKTNPLQKSESYAAYLKEDSVHSRNSAISTGSAGSRSVFRSKAGGTRGGSSASLGSGSFGGGESGRGRALPQRSNTMSSSSSGLMGLKKGDKFH
ncbi:hypothetical protein IAR50_000818 [Cryptococcus sp. DSM 104548]